MDFPVYRWGGSSSRVAPIICALIWLSVDTLHPIAVKCYSLVQLLTSESKDNFTPLSQVKCQGGASILGVWFHHGLCQEMP